MPEPQNGWERWRGGVDEKLDTICDDLREIKKSQQSQRYGAMQLGGIIGGLVSGLLLAAKWLFTKGG